MLPNLNEKVNSILKSAEIVDRHSFFQIKNFIIGKEPTHQGRLWQIFRELKARKASIEGLEDNILDVEDSLFLFDIQIEENNRKIDILLNSEGTFNDLKIKKLEFSNRKINRDKERLQNSLNSIVEKIKNIQEEISYFVVAFEKLSEIEPMKQLDDPVAQAEYWNEKLTEEINLRILTRRPIEVDLVKTAMALNHNAPIKQTVLKMLQAEQNRMIAQQEKDGGSNLDT